MFSLCYFIWLVIVRFHFKARLPFFSGHTCTFDLEIAKNWL
jgi:hypothetical protein